MAKRVDQDTWDRLVEAYRDDPGNHSAAARHALVQRKTARRAWDLGAPGKPWGVKAIKVLIAEDAELARSRLQLEAERDELVEDQAALEAERDREAVRQHSIRARKEEQALLVLTRQAVLRAMAATVSASEGVKEVMAKVGEQLKAVGAGGTMTQKELLNVTSMVRRYGAVIRDLTVAGQLTMEMERLHLGEPTEIIGVMTDLDRMPTDELVRMAGYQDRVLQRAQERGLVVLDGGKKAG